MRFAILVTETLLIPSQRSLTRLIVGDLPNNLAFRQFHSISLSRMVEALVGCFLESDVEAEFLLHLPREMVIELQNLPHFNELLEPELIYLCQIKPDDGKPLQFKSLARIKTGHPLFRELIAFTVSSTISAMLCAIKVDKDDSYTEQGAWSGLFTCVKEHLVKAFDLSLRFLTEVDRDGLLDEWFKSSQKRLEVVNSIHICNPAFGQFVTELASSLDRSRHARERELRWVHFLSRIQEAVGWELDIEGLFTATASVLKDGLGFHYLELNVINDEGNESRDTVMKRNETNYGGELLTLILRSDKRGELLSRSGSILLNNQDTIQSYFANALLIKYMSLKSGLLIPLRSLDQTGGLLKIFSCHENHYDQEAQEWMETVGRILSRSLRNVKTHTDLQRMATMDGLTNVYNRRFLTEQLHREFDRARRYNSALSLIMIDIDHFKFYNDTNGHLLGDRVLTQVARLTRMKVRGHDLVARYGGEEFVVILPETGLDNGRIVAEKVREAIEQTPFRNEEKQPNGKVTISLGIATMNDSVASPTELLNRADIALYEAKRRGRNRCEVFENLA